MVGCEMLVWGVKSKVSNVTHKHANHRTSYQLFAIVASTYVTSVLSLSIKLLVNIYNFQN